MEPTDIAVRNSIQNLGGGLSPEILALADVQGFAQKMQSLSTGLNQTNARMAEIANAPLWKKFWFHLTGKTGKTKEEALQMYGEVLEVVVQLSAMNTLFAKQISDHQRTVENLSREILEQGQIQDQQDQKHEKSLEEIKRRQVEILRLVEDQNKVFGVIPGLKDGLDELKKGFQGHDELLKAQTNDISFLKNEVAENKKALDEEQKMRLKLERKVRVVLIGVMALAIGTLTAFVLFYFRFR